MRVEVLKPFKDKHSGEIHKKGEVLTITKKRYEEIAGVDKNLVAEVKATEKAAE